MAKKIDLSGSGLRWRLLLIISNKDGEGKIKIYTINFNTENLGMAKEIILKQSQKILRRYKRVREKKIQIDAMPYFVNTPEVLNGDMTIRNKDRFWSSAILRIKNPDVVLVEGYGPKALAELHT